VAQEATRNDSYCLTCHDDPARETRLPDGIALSLYVDASALRDSAHGLMNCLSCHTERESRPSGQVAASGLADYQARAAEMCVRCHVAAAGSYGNSIHGQPVLSRNGDGATCNDCHSLDGSGHSTSPLASLRTSRQAERVAENCGSCHRDELETYRSTAHSRLVELGDERPAATCTNCHGDHAVAAVDDPGRPLAPARLALACGECHRDADERFAGEWLGHEASASPTGLADYIHRGVVLLMSIGVAFGLSHVALDFLRKPRRPGSGPA
jgi:5-methylcytosine-specific restriction endonuclease McrA